MLQFQQTVKGTFNTSSGFFSFFCPGSRQFPSNGQKWSNIRLILGILLSSWVFYVMYVMFTTHPCLHSGKCLAALVLGSNVSAFSSKSLSAQVTHVASTATTLQNIVFGIASSATKWPKRTDFVGLWWRPGVMRGYVWLDRQVAEEPQKNGLGMPVLKVSEDTSQIRYTFPKGLRSAIRISRIVSESFRMNLSDVHWFVMGDDDTVFFPDNLVQVLSKYDHREYYYIGSISESSDQNSAHSYGMAFGGGGFAISYPLAKALEKMQDACLNRYPYLYGSDERIHACLTDLGVPLTREPGFHQMDLRGNVFGLLSAHPQAPLVSLHHLDALKPIFPKLTQIEAFKLLFKAAEADSSRLLQQAICYDMDKKRTFSVSWGYSVELYRNIQLPKELENPHQTFIFWRKSMTNRFVFNTRNVSRNPCERPIIYFLQSVSIGSASITTTYTRDDQPLCRSDKDTKFPQHIVVLSPKIALNWKQAPRRQCCDVISPANSGSTLQIRKCMDEEVIYPQQE